MPNGYSHVSTAVNKAGLMLVDGSFIDLYLKSSLSTSLHSHSVDAEYIDLEH